VSNDAVSQARDELLLMAMSCPKALDLLDNLNIWIAVTAASCNSTPHQQGAVNIRKGNDGVIFGDQKSNDADIVFDLPGMITDQTTNKVCQLHYKMLSMSNWQDPTCSV
jgi:hypothetical protein